MIIEIQSHSRLLEGKLSSRTKVRWKETGGLCPALPLPSSLVPPLPSPPSLPPSTWVRAGQQLLPLALPGLVCSVSALSVLQLEVTHFKLSGLIFTLSSDII